MLTTIPDVNQESRKVGQRHYTICFEMLNRNKMYDFWLNTELDLIYRNGALPNIVENQYKKNWPKSGRPYPKPVQSTTGICHIEWNVPH
jgi:hypothetical protein